MRLQGAVVELSDCPSCPPEGEAHAATHLLKIGRARLHSHNCEYTHNRIVCQEDTLPVFGTAPRPPCRVDWPSQHRRAAQAQPAPFPEPKARPPPPLVTFRCKRPPLSPACRIQGVPQRRQIVDFWLDMAGLRGVDS